MGILDDAIREHLDLKRKHGARDVDIREIEDEAFGSTDRPDPFAGDELFGEVSPVAGETGAGPPADSAALLDEQGPPSGLGGPGLPDGLGEAD